MFKTTDSRYTRWIGLLVFVTLIHSQSILAEVAAAPPSEKCDCKKSMKVAVVRAVKPGVAPRADTGVAMANYSFTNQTIMINVGDTVTWTNTSGTHTVTADDSSFDSGNMNQGDTYIHKFMAAGTFAYHCNYHEGLGMVGSVVVQSGPAITSSLTAAAIAGTPFSYTLTANGTPAPTLSFTTVPADLQSNGATISGTFSAPGPVSIGLHAANGAGNDDEVLTITVLSPQNAPAMITSLLSANVKAGTAFNYTLVATGVPAPTLSFTNVPADLQTNGATISGTFSAPGQFSVGLHAASSSGNDDETLTINVGTAAVITSPLTATVTAGDNFNYTLTATGSPTPALSFTNVPSTLQTNGATISGAFGSTGQFAVGLHASNSFGSADSTLTINVLPITEVPMITSALTATSVVGANFSYVFTATGIPAPILTTGTLPSGLALNGATISGRFAAVGTFTIALTASNTAGTDNKSLSVTVTANTEGISGNWTGTLKGKIFDQTPGTKSASDSKTIGVSLTQVGSDVYAQIIVGGTTTYVLQGRIGMLNLWLAGQDTAGLNTITLSGHVAKTGKTIKGEDFILTPSACEQFTFSLARK